MYNKNIQHTQNKLLCLRMGVYNLFLEPNIMLIIILRTKELSITEITNIYNTTDNNITLKLVFPKY